VERRGGAGELGFVREERVGDAPPFRQCVWADQSRWSVSYVGCLLHSVAYEWGVACCTTVLHTLGAVACAKHAHLTGRRRTGLAAGEWGMLRRVYGHASMHTIGQLMCCGPNKPLWEDLHVHPDGAAFGIPQPWTA